jgi:riboflavin kinase
MHGYASDFYDYEMRAVVLGYIRPELDYTSRGSVVPFIDPLRILTGVQRP